MAKAEGVIFFDAILSMLLFAYGSAAGLTSQSLTALQNLPVPVLAPQPEFAGVSYGPLQSIINATAYIGWAIVNLPVLLLYLIQEFLLFVNIMLSVVFNPAFGDNGVPYLGFVFLGLQVYVVFEVIRIFRGSSSGV